MTSAPDDQLWVFADAPTPIPAGTRRVEDQNRGLREQSRSGSWRPLPATGNC